MKSRSPSLSPAYFERLYNGAVDPWNFAASDYERRKYRATLAALPQGRFRRAFEVGCSIGVFTRQLAAQCDALVAVDISETALRRARDHCDGLDNVDLRRMHIPKEWPEGAFDLILLSEVLYFLDLDDIRLTAQRVLTALRPGAAVLLVHWTRGTDYPCTGDDAVNCFIETVAASLSPVRQHREPEYRLDLLR